MHGLLAPAIQLMNRLTYAQKFGVISLTFFVPLLLLSYAIINNTYQLIAKAQQEQLSLVKVNHVLQIADEVRAYAELASVENTYQKAAITGPVEQKLQQIKASIADFTQRYGDHRSAELIQAKQQAWLEGLQRGGDHRLPTVVDQLKSYQQVVADVVFTANQVALHSGLSLDADEQVQQLLKVVLEHYPNSKGELALAHTAGVYALQESYIGNSTFDVLNDAYDALDARQKTLAKLHHSFLNSNPHFEAAFSQEFNSIESGVNDIKLKLDDEIISATTIAIQWPAFSEFYVQHSQGFNRVREKALQLVDDILLIRIDQLIARLVVVGAAITLVMLLIIYLYAAFFWSVRSTVGDFHSAARQISQGDMRVRVSSPSQDEMGELTHEFNVMVENIHSLLKAVQSTAHEVSGAMEQVGENAQKSNRAANEQLHQTEQVASAVTQMAATAGQVNQRSSEAFDAASSASHEAGQANQVVVDTLGQINKLADEIMRSTEVINTLSENSDNIASMLAVIKGIAEQTNLLALNAAIEAARAGEQGRGFAVVADEVRTLASRTQSSAQEIEEVMTSIHDGVSSAVEVMGKSHVMAQDTVESSAKVGTALEQIVEMVSAISNINNQISQSAAEQTDVAQTIDENVVKINELGRTTVDDAEHTVKAIKEVVALTESLQEKLQRFQV